MMVQVPGHPRYFVDESGVVVSTMFGKWRVLRPGTDRDGYLQVTLTHKKHAKVHRLVMLVFCGPSALQVNHKNGIKADNRLENLEYVSLSENLAHARLIGLTDDYGENSKNAKLSNQQVKEIRALQGSITQREVGVIYDIAPQTVSRIWRREMWKHLPNQE
jgi:hypothetical protein